MHFTHAYTWVTILQIKIQNTDARNHQQIMEVLHFRVFNHNLCPIIWLTIKISKYRATRRSTHLKIKTDYKKKKE